MAYKPDKRFEKKYKRVMDILEKLGVASVAVGVFQGKPWGTFFGLVFIVISVLGTKEN